MTAKRTPPPIDHPLARTFLQSFKGWVSEYPEGAADPASLQTAENVQLTREGAVRVRPGLRSVLADEPIQFGTGKSRGLRLIGGIGQFVTNDGKEAFLVCYQPQGTQERSFGAFVKTHKPGVPRDDYFTFVPLSMLGFENSGVTLPSTVDYVEYLHIDNKILALPDSSDDPVLFYTGEDKKVVVPREIPAPQWYGSNAPQAFVPATTWVNGAQTTVPTAGTASSTFLVHNDASKNTVNFAYFYTFYNEFGETPGSPIGTIKVQRTYNTWQTGGADASQLKSPDQIVVRIPRGAWLEAQSHGALGYSVYMLSWTDEGIRPAEGVLVASNPMESSYERHWVQHTALMSQAFESLPIPGKHNRINYTTPPKATQGMVVGDRVVVVRDPAHPGRIQWSSNALGEYLNFSASKGGGYKTLASGNLQVPSDVVLWTNPQSVDTPVVMCDGINGQSTAYYINFNSEVSGQTAAQTFVGFEETTATPGTVSPRGVEVLRHALYHPLDSELMKTTAANFNIHHSSMTDDIATEWKRLAHKEVIASGQLDGVLYYAVRTSTPSTVFSTSYDRYEVWACDTLNDGVWVRWHLTALSFHLVRVYGRLYMGVVHPRGLYILDPEAARDAIDSGSTSGAPATNVEIPWEVRTNLMGASKSHDAWAHVRQAEVSLGRFKGMVEWGLDGVDVYGRPFHAEKLTIAPNVSREPIPADMTDYLHVGHIAREWTFFARGKSGQAGFEGELNRVMFRMTSASVNVGYQYGSVESFEYGRHVAELNHPLPGITNADPDDR